MQQLASVVQPCEAFEQEGGGGPHTPELQTSVAEQQGKLALHDPPVLAHVGAGAAVSHVCDDVLQVAGEQQSASALHAVVLPALMQHFPAVAPAATVQVEGEQQSPFAVQLAPPGWHAPVLEAVLQTPFSHTAEQQSAPVAQAAPSPTQPPHTVPSKQ